MADGETSIAIVGIGALFPGADNAQQFWTNIVTGVDAIGEVPADRWESLFYDVESDAPDRVYCRRGGFVSSEVPFDPEVFGIMPISLESADPDHLIALRIAAEAVTDTVGGLPDRERVGVIIGRGGYFTPALIRLDQQVRGAAQLAQTLADLAPELAPERIAEIKKAFQARMAPARAEGAIDLVPNLAASRIANRLDLKGPAYTVDAACASSLLAVDQACRELRGGRCDAMIAGGVHHAQEINIWTVFGRLGALSRSQEIRPFDTDADGMLMGEGTGMILLKRLADAEAAGDRIYATIEGTGTASDGRGASLMVSSVEGQVLALERAWTDSGHDPDGIGLLEAHGTATTAGDKAELATVARFFGPAGNSQRVGLGSVKSMIGHPMPAAGIAGLIKTAFALHHQTLPPTLHCETPHPGFADGRFRPLTDAEPWESPPNAGCRLAAVSSFGFGGINAHVVLEEHRGDSGSGVIDPLPTRSMRLLRLAGEDQADLATGLNDADPTARVTRAPGEGTWRLAIADPDPKKLELARKIVDRANPWRGRQGVWFSPGPGLLTRGGQVAFLFPGVEPSFDPNIDDVAAHFDLPLPDQPTDIVTVQAESIVRVGRLFHSALTHMGIRPNLLAGHSVGEWNATIAGGMVTEAAAERILHEFDSRAVQLPDLVYAALGSSIGKIAEVIEATDGVVVSHDNCRHQVIICGEEERVADALGSLAEIGVMGHVLPFRSGFHSPMLKPWVEPGRNLIDSLELHAPKTPVWSATTASPYPEGQSEVKELLLRQLLEPVQFRTLIQRLYDQGARVFIQAGVGSLTGFVDDVLKGEDILAMAAGTESGSGLDQLRRLDAALWVEGSASHLASLGNLETAGSTQPAASTTKISLATQLIRLDDSDIRLDLGTAGAAGGDLGGADSSSDPVMAEYSAALADAMDAGREVRAAWEAASGSTPDEVVEELTVSLTAYPELIDHALVPQASSNTDPAETFPVVPMTMTIELLRQAATKLAPNSVAVGIENLRALTWLPATPPTTVTVRARMLDNDRVAVSIDGYSRGTVVLADTWPPPPSPSDETWGPVEPTTLSVKQVYSEGWLFHGPRYQGLRELGPSGPGGLSATIAALPALGAPLDSGAKLIGLWTMLHRDANQLALPRLVEKVTFYGPTPAPGQMLDVNAWIREESEQHVAGDLEYVDEQGRLWARVEGWECNRFVSDSVTWAVTMNPGFEKVGELQPGGWELVRERWGDSATRELTMRRYCNRGERDEYAQMNPNAQRQWLLGRVAAKDAVRRWLFDRGADEVFPAQVLVANDPDGRPTVGADDFDLGPGVLELSLAHSGSYGVAILSASGRPGIDIEKIEPRGSNFDQLTFAEGELDCLPGPLDDEWRARLWTAKEATAKAEGSGLEGNPRGFQVQSVSGEVVVISGRTLVTTIMDDPDGQRYAVAWTDDSKGNGDD